MSNESNIYHAQQLRRLRLTEFSGNAAIKIRLGGSETNFLDISNDELKAIAKILGVKLEIKEGMFNIKNIYCEPILIKD